MNVKASMRRRVLLTAVAAAVALWGLFAALSSRADDSCRSRCWAAYGACYKKTSNRQRCQALLRRCLSNCIRR